MGVEGKVIVLLASLALAALHGLSSSSVPRPVQNVRLKTLLESFSYFEGDWECAGKFDSSGKTIEAHEHFEADLDGTWLFSRRDDKPPFKYHAQSQWGWDSGHKGFVMLVQDSGGGAREFHSDGWDSGRLQWDGDALGTASAPSQRFTYERLDDRHFKVSYFTRKTGDWSRMDSSTCGKG
jgi:hypothetical protein